MKIVAFETREDERPTFRKLEQKHQIEIVCLPEEISKQNIGLTKGATAISILGHSQINAELLNLLKENGIDFVSTRTVGYNHIDLEEANKLGIRVANAYYDPHGVADYTVMLILMSLRKYKQAMWRANVNDYSLKGLKGREMRNLTIGVVGTGNIGAQVIQNLSGFGSRLLAFDTRKNPKVESLVEYMPLEQLYAEADIISYHVPLLASTHRMVNRETLAQMKDGVVLINCSRGELMNVSDVIDAIESHKIGALAMDVFENETGIYHQDRRTDIISNRDMAYIRQFPNVIMTQHIAFYTDAAVETMVECGVESLCDFVAKGETSREILAR
ncbi:D-isomer specific 2-hydroxyacid dehydrogenase family protein [Mangrovibacterium diazotrophicum]|uniref:D-lactate dehydrogenase n=1 Tax=Mangrovibacterium diazotrophicum TaxID=1261403 RepID=A0A419W6M6_9BACT|nr:D-isomer specific 2-hydroxyacid dehydrogenase family protein [Mangrovibacterium diazotrophicum]RKD91032.1 D-lactate dehydrogenase [Mangrovibacterium diazotrophicum]